MDPVKARNSFGRTKLSSAQHSSIRIVLTGRPEARQAAIDGQRHNCFQAIFTVVEAGSDSSSFEQASPLPS
jgi:hypothetical protein